MPNQSPTNFLDPLPVKSDNILLVVEDSEEDYEILVRIVNKTLINCQIYRCETGEEALYYLQKTYGNLPYYKRPFLILLDLNLPGTDGKAVLEHIKTDTHLKIIPVVIFSTSSNPKDVTDCYQRGANSYAIKSMDFKRLQDSLRLLLFYWNQINIFDHLLTE